MPKFVAQPKSRTQAGQEFLRSAPEFFIFLACRRVVGDVRRLERAYLVGEVEEPALAAQLTRAVTLLLRLAAATERFGIVLPVAKGGGLSPFFWSWFNWWDDHHRTLSREEINQLGSPGNSSQEAVNDYHPPGDWLNYRQTPVLEIFTYPAT